jgi:Tfp pilus assembly protein PilF
MVSCLPQMLGKILLALMLVQGAGNQSRGLIRGQIIVPLAHASDRILVILQKSDGPLIGRIFSDPLGHYEFPGLMPGNYTVIVTVEGYEDVRQEVGVGTGVYGIQTVNIPLKEKITLVTVKNGGRPDDEIVDLNELGRKYPRKAAQDYEKAIGEIRKGNPAKAVDLLTGLLKLAPDFYNAHNTLGTLYQKAARFPEAEDEYRRARELNPKSTVPLVNLGSLFIDEAAARARDREAAGKILDDALDILEESLKMKRSAPAYFFLGTAYYRSSFYKEAEQNLKHALELDAHMGASRLMLANVYMKQQKWDGALEQLDGYLSENPKASDHAQIEETRFQVARKMKQ